MIRLVALLAAALALCAGSAQAASSHLRLVRVVLVMRHGVRPPIQSNADLAKYADQPWPTWPVVPGDLTPHGGETVRLMGQSVRERYRASLLPKTGCAGAGAVSVWADGSDQRTRETGRIFAAAVQPGCGLKAAFAAPQPRDPIFGGSDAAACRMDADKLRAAMAVAAADPAVAGVDVGPPLAKLQAIFAPAACKGGAGTCLSGSDSTAMAGSVLPAVGGLAEDLLLEYGDGKPMREVGWGRASAADITEVMALHERAFALLRANTYASAVRGAPMARVVLAALAGKPVAGGPQSGPDLKLMTLAGHDTNLVLMAGVFGLNWTLPGEPDSTAPSNVLAFELWRDGARQFVRPVIYYETLDQLRTLKPARARTLPLSFRDCADGPMGGCALETVTQRVEALLPPGCGEL